MLDIKCYRGFATDEWVTNGIWAINRIRIKEMIAEKIFKKAPFSKIIDIAPGDYLNNFKERNGDGQPASIDRMITNAKMGPSHKLTKTNYGLFVHEKWHNVLSVDDMQGKYVIYRNCFDDLFCPYTKAMSFGTDPSKRPICLSHNGLYAVLMPITICGNELDGLKGVENFLDLNWRGNE